METIYWTSLNDNNDDDVDDDAESSVESSDESFVPSGSDEDDDESEPSSADGGEDDDDKAEIARTIPQGKSRGKAEEMQAKPTKPPARRTPPSLLQMLSWSSACVTADVE